MFSSIDTQTLQVLEVLLKQAVDAYESLQTKKISAREYQNTIAKLLDATKFFVFSSIQDAGFEIVNREELERRIESDFIMLLKELFEGKRQIRNGFRSFLKKRMLDHIILVGLKHKYILNKYSQAELSENQNGRQLPDYYDLDWSFFSIFELNGNGNGNGKQKRDDCLKVKKAKHFVYTGFRQESLF